MTAMARLKKMVTFAIDPALLKRLDDWIARQELPPSKTALFELALKRLLEELERKTRKR